jgi:hypothetical protein
MAPVKKTVVAGHDKRIKPFTLTTAELEKTLYTDYGHLKLGAWTLVNMTPHTLFVDRDGGKYDKDKDVTFFEHVVGPSAWEMKYAPRLTQKACRRMGNVRVLKPDRADTTTNMPFIVNTLVKNCVGGPLNNVCQTNMWWRAQAPFFWMIREKKKKKKMALIVSEAVGQWFRDNTSADGKPPDVLSSYWNNVAIIGPNTAPRNVNTKGAERGEGRVSGDNTEEGEDGGNLICTTGFVAYYLPNAV